MTHDPLDRNTMQSAAVTTTTYPRGRLRDSLPALTATLPPTPLPLPLTARVTLADPA